MTFFARRLERGEKMYKENKNIISLLVFFAVILITLSIKAPAFFTLQNLSDIVLNSSTVAIVALGMITVILIGQIDVSVGAILAICCAVTGMLAKAGLPVPVVVVASIAVGALLGLINGSFVALLGLDAIVVTLGTLSIYRGLLILWTNGKWISGLPQEILAIGQGKVFGIPIPVIIAGLVFIIMYLVLKYASFGRNFYAVGSNSKAARLSGINVRRTQINAFMINGALVGVAALIYATRFGGIQSNTGQGFEMTVIAAVVVGGASTLGGSGTALGTLLGSLLVSTIGTILIFFNISAFWEQAVQGLIILLSVSLYAFGYKGMKIPMLSSKKGVSGNDKQNNKA
ncbi:ABC transporter permease [Petroclostridium sp. X23]|uniref:ABC transporter permease n=1 Tax=Petroclostridium sp. X23 TaxID=3045146 RepID=UPI0024ACAE04|nr:ABC transporter permease [Petroclostridium sp. X23]WHH57273.1 ABC transporter permease [Petroclostridium sp. X23]